MEEEKSRVVLYAKHRKKIEKIGVYSFSENDTAKKHLPQYNQSSVKMIDDSFKPKIKKNTLSLTIDELIKEHKQYNSKEQQKEIKRRYSHQNRVNNKNENSKAIKFVWVLIVFLLIAAIAILVVFIILGVRK